MEGSREKITEDGDIGWSDEALVGLASASPKLSCGQTDTVRSKGAPWQILYAGMLLTLRESRASREQHICLTTPVE